MTDNDLKEGFVLKSLTAIVIAKVRNSFYGKELEDFRSLYTDPPISFSEEYPAVPEPARKLSPAILAAEWVRGDLHAEDMPEIAADLLQSGLDTPAIRRLAGEMRVASSADIEPIIERMFRELSVPYPMSETEAFLVYSRQISREVIHGKRNAWAAASHLVKGTWSRHREIPEIHAFSELLDSLDWNTVRGGTLPELTAELIEVFARLGAATGREKRPIVYGLLDGKGWIADDFDATLPDDLLAQFEGRDAPEW